MTLTREMTLIGSDFNRDEQQAGWFAFINNGEYTSEQQGALVAALMSAQNEAFDALLPERVSWQPYRTILVYDEDAEVPDTEELKEHMEAAVRSVVERFEAIEAEALASE
jgi:hypothetical protein